MEIKRGTEPVRYSTAHIPRDQRHDAWKQRGWPSIAALFDSTPIGEFSTSAENANLNGIMVSYTLGTARILERTSARIAADGINVLGVSALLEGQINGSAGARRFEVGPGEIVLLDIAQPSSVTLSISRTIQLAVPRPLAEAELGPMDLLHGLVIGRDEAAMLHSHLLKLSDILHRIPEDDTPRVARTLLDLLVLAVNASGRAQHAMPDKAGSALALRAYSDIRQNLGSPTLTAANLCRRLQISRSTLHRLFEKDGGVQAYIRNSRLDLGRMLLLDPNNPDRIGDIAETLGFSDAAHFSRLFRTRFGETPSRFRARAGE